MQSAKVSKLPIRKEERSVIVAPAQMEVGPCALADKISPSVESLFQQLLIRPLLCGRSRTPIRGIILSTRLITERESLLPRARECLKKHAPRLRTSARVSNVVYEELQRCHGIKLSELSECGQTGEPPLLRVCGAMGDRVPQWASADWQDVISSVENFEHELKVHSLIGSNRMYAVTWTFYP